MLCYKINLIFMLQMRETGLGLDLLLKVTPSDLHKPGLTLGVLFLWLYPYSSIKYLLSCSLAD